MLADTNGNHPFLFACISNRLENVKYWLERFPEWDLEAPNDVLGGVALGCGVYMGPNRLELTELLLKRGSKLTTTTYGGSTILHSICSNVDADLRVLALVLKSDSDDLLINYKRKPRTLKWKSIYFLAKTVSRVSSGNLLFRFLARESGETALQRAAWYGDVEMVSILLNAGADPNLKNDLGDDAAAMCKHFPELFGMLMKRKRKIELKGEVTKKHIIVENLGKRISTATPLQHDMWLISLETLLMLYVSFFVCVSDLIKARRMKCENNGFFLSIS